MKKKLIITPLIIIIFMHSSLAKSANKVQISYVVSFPEAVAHYTNIEMNISGLNQKFIEVKMPVWTPGSYLVREFSKNIESLNVYSDGKVVHWQKVNKNTWKVNTHGLN